MLAPIVIFAFNRPENILEMIDSLSKCELSGESQLYVYIDGPRSELDSIKCNDVREIIESYSHHFKEVQITQRKLNFGLAKSLISGVSDVFKNHDSVIVLEDDLVFTNNFLVYMNEAISYYKNNKRIGSISGFSTKMSGIIDNKEDVYTHPRACSWGWATWKDRWNSCDWEYRPRTLLETMALRNMTRKAGQDVYRMFLHQLNGKINSWAIRWTIHHLRNNLHVIYPYKSKVRNIGFGVDATHCKGTNPFPILLDESNNYSFIFSKNIEYNKKNISKVNYYHSNFYKLLFKLGLK
ncbi:glycosyltransferase family protein [Vibrio campbellii]|uniref:glycosyltransferase n=1 Tax=Vibrio campbellii TaxID=680 RepID=UPI001F223AE0|nr:glycosyltransferase [Vibrio campbellii]MCE7728138.1 glycosyltransferase [Vibrio campbellii]